MLLNIGKIHCVQLGLRHFFGLALFDDADNRPTIHYFDDNSNNNKDYDNDYDGYDVND